MCLTLKFTSFVALNTEACRGPTIGRADLTRWLKWCAISTHTRVMGNHTTQHIVAGTSTSTSATTQRQSSRAYIEVDVDGAGKVSALESGGRGKVAQQKIHIHTHTHRQTTLGCQRGTHHATDQRIPAAVCAYVQHYSLATGGTSVLLEASALSTHMIRP